MKRTYQKPEVQIVRIAMQMRMLIGSDTDKSLLYKEEPVDDLLPPL